MTRAYQPIAAEKRYGSRRGGGLHRLPDLVSKLLAPASRRRGLAEARLLTDWPAIVGSSVAARCQPVKLTPDRRDVGGTLHLHVAGTAALELQHSEPQLRRADQRLFRSSSGGTPPADQSSPGATASPEDETQGRTRFGSTRRDRKSCRDGGQRRSSCGACRTGCRHQNGGLHGRGSHLRSPSPA